MKTVSKKAPTQSTGILCWVCKDSEEVLRVLSKFRTLHDCTPLLSGNPERRLLLENFFGQLTNQTMAYRLVHLDDGKIVVHSADLVYVTDSAQWNDIFIFPTVSLYGKDREDERLISRLTQVKQFEKSNECSTKAMCPLCLKKFDENHAARIHLFEQCLSELARITNAPLLL